MIIIRLAVRLGGVVRLGGISAGMVLALVLCLVGSPLSGASGPEATNDRMFPSSVNGNEWIREGAPVEYGPEKLVYYLGIEAELYYPYGARSVMAASYGKTTNPGMVITVEVFEMGSRLDAFGLFSSYRDAGCQPVNAGTDGCFGSGRLMFWKDRFFVRLKGTGTLQADRPGLTTVAHNVASMIPGTGGRPGVLELIMLPGVVPGTEKYLARNVLGYPFFPKGLVADVRIGGDQTAKLFVILSPSPEEAETVFIRYARYLAGAAVQPVIQIENVKRTLRGQDPVYKNVIVRQHRAFVFGAVDLREGERGLSLVEEMEKRIARLAGSSPP